MSERNLRGYIVKGLKKEGAFVHAVENPCHPGTPDLYGCYRGIMFWIELKWAADWPKRNGKLDMRHFTRQQRLWLRLHAAEGGRSFVLLQVYNEWFLFDGVTAANLLGEIGREVIADRCDWFWDKQINFYRLLERIISYEHS